MFWKIQDVCYQMGTDIFKIEKEMTKKMKPKVANPPLQNGQNIGVLFLNRVRNFRHRNKVALLWSEAQMTYSHYKMTNSYH